MIRRLLSTVLLGVSLAGCSDAVGPTHDLSDAQQRWLRTRPDHYRFTLSVGCFCGVTGPVVMEVRGDSVVERRVVATGAPLDPRFGGNGYTSIDGLFAVIGQALAAGARQVDVRYDANRGYPTTIAIDGEERIADDEISYAITSFEPLTP